MKKNTSLGAFTLIELLVVISIIAILAALAVPALTGALKRGQLTNTMNNGRQLFIAAQSMALDGSANSDPNYQWPGDYTTNKPSDLKGYAERLIYNDYLKVGDIQKILSAPGAQCTAEYNGGAGAQAGTLTLTGRSSLKVYMVQENNSSNTIFAASSNYKYNQVLEADAQPYGDAGFVVVRKGGDASVYKKNQATVGQGTPQQFLSTVGKMPGGDDTTVGNEDSSKTLYGPQGSSVKG